MTDPFTAREADGPSALRLLMMVATIIIAAAGLAAVAAPTARAADACSNVEVAFARGTGEPVGLGRVGDAFVDALRADLKGQTVSTYAVNYPASYDFLKASEGANDLSAHIQSTAIACPDTKIVLGGFSQGAAVVDFVTAAPGPMFGFTNLLAPEVGSHVAAVATFGNPSDKIGRPLASWSQLYGARTIDLCNGADPVCSPGSDRAAHSQYVEAGMTNQAADFVAAQIKGAPTGVVNQLSGQG
jgi:cutinase